MRIFFPVIKKTAGMMVQCWSLSLYGAITVMKGNDKKQSLNLLL
jgi:hypothetical protein